MTVYLTADMEQDCPPYLNTWRGMEEGAPSLLELVAEEQVPTTFFATGQAARRYPDLTARMASNGHELGCHGDTHRSFAELTPAEGEREIQDASRSLRAFGDVVSFRAPYLRLPSAMLRTLSAEGYRLDSSQGRHKALGIRIHSDNGILRVPASITSSTLRWPAWLRNPLLARLQDPVVLFVHPWEFVDLRRERVRIDCRFKTGETALSCLRETIRFFKKRGATFARMRDCLHA